MAESRPDSYWPEGVIWAIAVLILLAGVALGLAAPALIQLWGALVLIGAATLFWWQRIPLTRATAPKPNAEENLAEHRRMVLIIFGASLLFQILRWVAEEGALRSKAGDDDEAYVFLAYQILGMFDAPPVFALRPPGWPGLIAGLLSLFGHEAVWSVGLFHRLLLAALPLLLYTILARTLRAPVAGAAALLSMAMEYNEAIAMSAFSDLSYMALGFASLFGLWMALGSRRPTWWVIFAALMGALKGMIRLSGAAVVFASLLAFLIVLPGGWRRRFQYGTLFSLPTIVAILALGFYNQAATGRFGISTVGSFTLLYHYGPFIDTAPDAPAAREFAALLPEVPPEYVFRTPANLWVAQYRYTAQGGNIFGYGALIDRAAQEMVRTRTHAYLTRLSQALLITLADPWRHLLPSSWLMFPTELPYEADFVDHIPACNMQYTFGAVIADHVCDLYEPLHARLDYQPRWLENVPAPILGLDHLLAVSLPYRVRFLIWPFYWGLAALAGMIYLLTQPMTRRLAILLGVPLIAELTVLLAATNGLETRYLFYLHPTYLLFTWLAFCHAFDRLQDHLHLSRSQTAHEE